MTLKFVPEFYFDTFNKATSAFLIQNGVRGVVLDVDNTLEPYENEKPGKHVIEWFNSLTEAGISFAIVSNNDGERIKKFSEGLNIPIYYKAKKPFAKNVLLAMDKMGTNKENTILMGDQIFTDVWAAHNAGIRAILVPPIKDKTDVFTKFKRLLEKPVLRKYAKKIINNQAENRG